MAVSSVIEAFNHLHEQTSLSLERSDGRQTILRLSGELDLQGSAHLTPTMESILQEMEPASRLVLDMSAVRYISSTGVGMLTNTLLSAKRQGKRMALIKLQPKVAGVFQLLGVMQFFEADDKNA